MDTTNKLAVGGRYNWKGQPEHLVYIGRNWSGNGYWHQFELVGRPGVVWCEVVDADLGKFEESKPSDAAQVTQAVSEPVAWLFECRKPGKRETFASVFKDDTTHWPVDQWTEVKVTPLGPITHPAPASASEPYPDHNVKRPTSEPVVLSMKRSERASLSPEAFMALQHGAEKMAQVAKADDEYKRSQGAGRERLANTVLASASEPTLVAAADQVVEADRSQSLTQEHIDYLAAQVKAARASASVPAKPLESLAQINAAFEAWVDDYPVQIVGQLYDYCQDAFNAGRATVVAADFEPSASVAGAGEASTEGAAPTQPKGRALHQSWYPDPKPTLYVKCIDGTFREAADHER